MKTLTTTIASLALAHCAVAQRPADDIGLTARVGPATVTLGQQCGMPGCTPVSSVNVAPNDAITFGHGSFPQTPFVLALGLPGPCVTFPGIQNSLLLPGAAEVLAVGLTSAPPLVPTPCNQGVAAHVLTIPAFVPLGLTFRVQGAGTSSSGGFAFGPALEFATR